MVFYLVHGLRVTRVQGKSNMFVVGAVTVSEGCLWLWLWGALGCKVSRVLWTEALGAFNNIGQPLITLEYTLHNYPTLPHQQISGSPY